MVEQDLVWTIHWEPEQVGSIFRDKEVIFRDMSKMINILNSKDLIG